MKREHPDSLTVQWLPSVKVQDNKDYAVHKLILGTHTSGSEQNYLMIANVNLPVAGAEIDNRTYDDEKGEMGGFGGVHGKVRELVARGGGRGGCGAGEGVVGVGFEDWEETIQRRSYRAGSVLILTWRLSLQELRVPTRPTAYRRFRSRLTLGFFFISSWLCW